MRVIVTGAVFFASISLVSCTNSTCNDWNGSLVALSNENSIELNVPVVMGQDNQGEVTFQLEDSGKYLINYSWIGTDNNNYTGLPMGLKITSTLSDGEDSEIANHKLDIDYKTYATGLEYFYSNISRKYKNCQLTLSSNVSIIENGKEYKGQIKIVILKHRFGFLD